MIALLLLFADVLKVADPVRQVLGQALTPVRFMLTAPRDLADTIDSYMTEHESLVTENEALHARIRVLQVQNQRVASLQAENDRMRALLGASEELEARVLAAEILSLDPDPYTHQVVINRGKADGVTLGMPILDAGGVMGQVVQVEAYQSQVLLVADRNHAIPVQVNRNGVRAIAVGSGRLGELTLVHVPDTADIQEGDLLVTSGLGQRFPEGYPVGTVRSVSQDPAKDFANVSAIPSAALDRSRHVILLMNPTEVLNELEPQ